MNYSYPSFYCSNIYVAYLDTLLHSRFVVSGFGLPRWKLLRSRFSWLPDANSVCVCRVIPPPNFLEAARIIIDSLRPYYYYYSLLLCCLLPPSLAASSHCRRTYGRCNHRLKIRMDFYQEYRESDIRKGNSENLMPPIIFSIVSYVASFFRQFWPTSSFLSTSLSVGAASWS